MQSDRHLNDNILIRLAMIEDIESITNIYNQGIRSKICTFDEFEITGDRYIKYITDNTGKYALLVAENKGEIIGWTSIEPISERWAYRFTCLSSTYIKEGYTGSYVGHQLSSAKFNTAKELGFHSIIAETLSTNPKSVAFLMSLGYRIVGEIVEAGYRDNKWIGLVVLQKILI